MRAEKDPLYVALMETFERILGFGTGTGSIKGVHVMNDLAQCVLGGAPAHGGDLLCRVIRETKREKGEDNSDAAMRADERFGEAYRRALPEGLGAGQVSRVREAAASLLGFDGGMYNAGANMASALATHRDLLGFEGFRRFGVGRYLCQILGEQGRGRLAEIFADPSDPLSRALGPLRLSAPLRDTHPGEGEIPLSAFDEALGERLTTLLGHPLTKTALLRHLLMLSTLGVALKILGAGRPDGRPFALATTAEESAGPRPLRQEATQSFSQGVAAFYERVAAQLPEHPRAAELKAPRGADAGAFRALVAGAREGALRKEVYWPEDFAVALGRKAGCVLPRRDQAGWGKHLALTSDMVEALILSGTQADAAVSWTDLWAAIREDIGLVVGVGDFDDTKFLREGGVLHVDLDALARNSEIILDQAVRRGVARRLPDSGAEAGGALQ
jgi:hypothetical protein